MSRFCYKCYMLSQKKLRIDMEKMIAVDLEEIIYYCKICGHWEVIVDFIRDRDTNGKQIGNSYPKSVFNKYKNSGLPTIFDSAAENRQWVNRDKIDRVVEQAKLKGF